MSPIEIYFDGRPVGKSSSGPSEIKLPEPPGGKLIWTGDKSGFGYIVFDLDGEPEFFQLTELGQEAPIEIAESLSASLFPNAANTPKKEIIIRRV